jgi:hypothetical protein
MALFAVAAVGVAGCSASDDAVSTGSVSVDAATSTVAGDPTGPDTTAPPTVVPDSITLPIPASSTPAPSALPAVDAGDCAVGEPRAAITYVVDGQLLELSADELRATCLAELPGPLSGSVSWSPGGDRVLLGADTVLDTNGVRSTGFTAGNTGVRWSYPTGKALIAPESQNGSLVWRNSRNGGDQLDVTFLARTDVAVYHPAGKDIIAAGVGPDGVAGLYLASNRGADARVITTLDDPTTSINEIAVDPSGLQLYFVHDHGSVKHIHTLLMQGLLLGEMASSEQPLGGLTLGVDSSSFLAYREGDCAVIVATKIPDGAAGTALTAPGLEGRSVSPVGWLDSSRLVVAVRDRGCDGPAEVWIVTPDGSGHQVLPMVEAVSVRTVLSSWGELPDDINAQAPG